MYVKVTQWLGLSIYSLPTGSSHTLTACTHIHPCNSDVLQSVIFGNVCACHCALSRRTAGAIAILQKILRPSSWRRRNLAATRARPSKSMRPKLCIHYFNRFVTISQGNSLSKMAALSSHSVNMVRTSLSSPLCWLCKD